MPINKRPKIAVTGKLEAHHIFENKALMMGDNELRRSNAAGAHDNRPNRQRSRRDAKSAAVRDQGY